MREVLAVLWVLAVMIWLVVAGGGLWAVTALVSALPPVPALIAGVVVGGVWGGVIVRVLVAFLYPGFGRRR